MNFLYTKRETKDEYDTEAEKSWHKYIAWSRLTQLTELVSLDVMLNEDLVAPDYSNADDWNYIQTVTYGSNSYITGFFTTIEYVMSRSKKQEYFNLLAVVIEPNHDCKKVSLTGFVLLGYELLDKDCGISALTNCGGFDETFLPTDLNNVGLIDDYNQAYDIKKRLLENNPGEHHADTVVIAVWRHNSLGRRKPNP